ncbi:unnamed protein product [Pocillopora meandrina]|uniref:Uncharacterized protein n=1 Tax=Pocillopora meandrina TaxID=46732 RepID=A0AAU9WPM6_9CNID|nr:unnamed protein product [Pocillopora meandrina]
MDKHRMRKASKWCNEQRVEQVMAINRREESILQKKLDQLNREKNYLLQELDHKIKKIGRDLKKGPTGPEKSKLMSRRNSLPAIESTKLNAGMVNSRKWRSLTQCSSHEKLNDEVNDREASKDVLFEIENDFKFLSVAFNKGRTQDCSSSKVTALPGIKNSTPGSTAFSSKPALMRRRHSDVIALLGHVQKHRAVERRSSLGNIHEFRRK